MSDHPLTTVIVLNQVEESPSCSTDINGGAIPLVNDGVIPFVNDGVIPLVIVTASSMTIPETCRICHDEASAQLALISPCECRGTMAYVHQSCIDRWLMTSQTTDCEICGYKYETESDRPSVKKWLTSPMSSRDRCIVMSDLVCLVILTSLVLLTVWICISVAVDITDHSVWFWKVVLLFARLFVTAAFYTLWGVLNWRYYSHKYQEWLKLNRSIRIIPRQIK